DDQQVPELPTESEALVEERSRTVVVPLEQRNRPEVAEGVGDVALVAEVPPQGEALLEEPASLGILVRVELRAREAVKRGGDRPLVPGGLRFREALVSEPLGVLAPSLHGGDEAEVGEREDKTFSFTKLAEEVCAPLEGRDCLVVTSFDKRDAAEPVQRLRLDVRRDG